MNKVINVVGDILDVAVVVVPVVVASAALVGMILSRV